MRVMKYGNVQTMTSDGVKHASQKEATRWCELKLLQKAGKISDLQRQVEFELIPTQYETYERFSKRGELLGEGMRVAERKVSYIADFVYIDNETGEKVVEDTKGMRTKDYIIKRKLMRYIHHIKIKEV
jgi:hypothetical protein